MTPVLPGLPLTGLRSLVMRGSDTSAAGSAAKWLKQPPGHVGSDVSAAGSAAKWLLAMRVVTSVLPG